jgi:hypothetical protein
VYHTAALHNNQGGDAGYTEFGCQLGGIVHVDLTHGKVGTLLGDLVYNGGNHTARTAPIGVKVEEDGLFAIFNGFKIFFIYF